MPTLTSGQQHVFFNLPDHIGSTSFLIDKATGELVEFGTYQAYGAAESDYRPTRWAAFREPLRFSGKEEDIEVGLAYFGARYYSPYLTTWLSPDPVTAHDGGSDPNPYAYVHGSPVMLTDPDGREVDWGMVGSIAAAVINPASAGYAATSIATQTVANGGTNNIQWGWNGVAGAIVVGHVAGGVSAGVGSVVGGVAGAGIGVFVTGAAAGAASYVTSSALTGESMSWEGLGKASAVGGAAGLAGAGGSMAPGSVGGAIGSSVAGTAGGTGMQLAFGDQIDGKVLALSFGIGLAQSVASAQGGSATSGPGDSPISPASGRNFDPDGSRKAGLEYAIARKLFGPNAERDIDGAIDLSAAYWKINDHKLTLQRNSQQADAGDTEYYWETGQVVISIGPDGLQSTKYLISTMYHEGVYHLGQARGGQWANPDSQPWGAAA